MLLQTWGSREYNYEGVDKGKVYKVTRQLDLALSFCILKY